MSNWQVHVTVSLLKVAGVWSSSSKQNVIWYKTVSFFFIKKTLGFSKILCSGSLSNAE